MAADYEHLLNRAIEKIPKRASGGERFEIPKLSGATIGKKTIIFNFSEICDRMNRDPKHVLKYLSREMATAGSLEGGRVIFQGKFRESFIHTLLEAYSSRYVVCSICSRPDTKLEKEDRFYFIVCEACGAKSSVPPI